MLLLDLFEAPRLTTSEKLWVNPSAQKIIVVPNDEHHTQYAYLNPPKFGLSGNLFAGYEYPVTTGWIEGMSMAYDQVVGKEMFDRGWVRVNVSGNGLRAELHGNDLKIIAKALNYMKRNNYNINSIIIAVGNDIDADAEYIINDPKEIRLFMRNGVIPRKRINENDYDSWKTWWANPLIGDQLIDLSGTENSHWEYVKVNYMNMVADKRGAKNLIDNYDLDEDNKAFYKLVDMVYNSGWVRVGRPTIRKMYASGSNPRSIRLAIKKIMKELNYPEVSIDIHNVDSNEWYTLKDDNLYRYLKTGRIPRERITPAGLEESVGGNLLYHGTLLYKANRILQDKALTKGRISHRIMRINPRDLKASKRDELSFSMSRDPNLNFADLGKGNAEIVFVFRKDVLANTFAISPFDFAGSASVSHGSKMPAMPAGGVKPREESEEVIYGTRIPVNNRTVAKIIIKSSAYGDDGKGGGTGGDLDWFRRLAKKNNIPVEDTQ